MKIIISSQEMFLTPVTICRELWPGFVVGGFFSQELSTCKRVGISVKGLASSHMGADFLKSFCSDLSESLCP